MSTGRRPPLGFTLIELMIVVAIIAILAKIAYPAYMQSARKAHRADAKVALLDLSQREERYFGTTNTYTASPASLGYASDATFPMPIQAGSSAYYTLSVSNVSTTTFNATAVPLGGQTADSCGTYALSQDGSQVASGTGAGSDCW
jgi:type IV pilus assembly protein PilE